MSLIFPHRFDPLRAGRADTVSCLLTLHPLRPQLSPEKQKAWGWRPNAGDPNHTGRGGPPPTDLSEVDGWVGEDPEEEV